MEFKLRLSFGSKAARQPEAPPKRPYHAVSVRAGRDACEAAQSFAGKRVLSAEALLLPLADCDRANRCTCSYRHHDDRRAGPRRQADGAPSAGGTAEHAERRESKGRRSEDHAEYDDLESDEAEESSLVADTYYGYARKSGAD